MCVNQTAATKQTAHSLKLELQGAIPRVTKYNKKTVYGAAAIFIILFVLFFQLSHKTKQPQVSLYNPSELTEQYVPNIPAEIANNKVSYSSDKVVIPKLDSESSMAANGQSNYNSDSMLTAVHNGKLPSNQTHKLKVNAEDDNEDLIKDLAREQMLQELELKKQALQSDLVLTSCSSGSGSSQIKELITGDGSGNSNLDVLGSQDFDEYKRQNGKIDKLNFLTKNRNAENTENDFDEEPVRSPYTILAGTIIPCTLDSAINSDLPGYVKAKVRENVYDTMTGNHKLIPQGATLIGEYNGDISYGQNRVQIVFTRILLGPTKKHPNGYSIKLGSFQGADLAGQAGVNDRVNHHFGNVLAGAVLTSLLSATANQSGGERELPRTAKQIMAENVGAEINRIGSEISQKQINRAPTITIRNGTPLNVTVVKDLTLSPRTQ